MVPMNIALGPKAVCSILDNYSNRSKMEQHCLVYTDKMIERYMDIDINAAESLIGYIDAHEGEEGFSKKMNDSPSACEPLEQMLPRICPREEKTFPSNIVILFEDENGREIQALGKKKANILTTKEIESDRKNIFNMLSPDTGTLNVEPGESCRYWAEYFSRIIEGEKTVIIMNRYTLNQESFQSLKDYYLPCFKKLNKIQIYASDSFVCISRDEAKKMINEDEDLKGMNIELYLLDEPEKCHERWIQTDNYCIYQGKGIGMLSSNKAKRTSASSTVIVEKWFRKLPRAEQVL